MPPHGHGGGGHHGGHHGGGHHHGHGHHGGYANPGWGPGWGWYGDPGYTEVVVTACPEIYAPVLGSDGRTYPNACQAQMAGVKVVRSLQPGMAGLEDLATPRNLAVVAGIGVVAYLLLRRRRRR